MPVILRQIERKTKTTFQLDINHNGIRNRVRLPELFLYNKPANPVERNHNREALIMAEKKRADKELEIMQDANAIDAAVHQEGNLLSYFNAFADNYKRTDVKKVTAMIAQLQSCHGAGHTFRSVNENFVSDFKTWLEGKVMGSTGKAYFIKFCQVLRRAHIDKLCKYDIEKFKNKRFDIDESILSKETLEPEELQKLAGTHYQNSTVKYAFLFCCFQGFDFADVFALQWKHIEPDGIRKPREKTKTKRLMPIHETTAQILALMDKSTEYVFQGLPSRAKGHKSSWQSSGYNLRTWVKAADIDKHITWHCARHTFGTLAEGDDRVVAQLLGHKGTRQVAVYRRTKDAKLKAAVNSIKPVNLG